MIGDESPIVYCVDSDATPVELTQVYLCFREKIRFLSVVLQGAPGCTRQKNF